jgi:hypothetical protein
MSAYKRKTSDACVLEEPETDAAQLQRMLVAAAKGTGRILLEIFSGVGRVAASSEQLGTNAVALDILHGIDILAEGRGCTTMTEMKRHYYIYLYKSQSLPCVRSAATHSPVDPGASGSRMHAGTAMQHMVASTARKTRTLWLETWMATCTAVF